MFKQPAVRLLNAHTARALSTTRISMTASAQSATPKEDPSVTSQYDNETPISEQIQDFYKFADSQRIGLLQTQRSQVGPVTRAMACAKRDGPDFWFLANINSNKVKDIKSSPSVNISFFDSSDKSWCSVSGTATVSQDQPKIKELYSPVVSAWFGDLGDGIHTGSADDPRMSAIKVSSNYISYYKTTKGKVARMADMAMAVGLGRLAQTGILREIKAEAIEGSRATKQY